MDGYSATKKIRSSQDRRRMPVVAVTAHSGAEEIKKCLDSGCTTYLPKPFRKKSLIKTIRQYLQPVPASENGDRDNLRTFS